MNRLLDGIIVIGLLIVCAWQWIPEIENADFHRDEARWIHRAEYVRYLPEPNGPYWDEATWADGATLDERNRLRAQPPLGSYMMGVGLLVQGQDLDVNGFWNMDQSTEWNEAEGNMPARSDLLAARRTTGAVAALTVVLVYAIGTRLTNRFGGVAGALFLAMHPLMALLASFAGSDTMLALTIALAGVMAWRFGDAPRWHWAIGLGIALGLGGATKLSPLAVALLFGAVGMGVTALATLGFGRSRLVQLLVGPIGFWIGIRLLTVPVIAAATFIGAYPWLWRDPIENTLALFDYRQMGMELQGAIWNHIAVESRLEAIERVIRRLGEELTIFGQVELVVAAFGVLLWLVLAVRKGVVSAPSLLFGVFGGQAVVTLAGMRVDWARYHLPILLFLAVALGVAIGSAWSLGSRSAKVAR